MYSKNEGNIFSKLGRNNFSNMRIVIFRNPTLFCKYISRKTEIFISKIFDVKLFFAYDGILVGFPISIVKVN